MDISFVLGSFANRPDHPDFWKMSEIVLRLDGMMAEAGDDLDEVFEGEMARHVDLRSVFYVGFQRAIRVLGIETADEVKDRMDEVVPLVQMHTDGFIIGCNFKEKS